MGSKTGDLYLQEHVISNRDLRPILTLFFFIYIVFKNII